MRETSHRARSLMVVAGGALGWFVFVMAVITGEGAYGGLGLFGLMTLAVSWIAGRVLTRDVAERRAEQVDEYEFERRSGVRDIGYMVALGALILGFVLLVVALNLADRGVVGLMRRSPHLALAGYLIAASLPTFLLVWRTSDDEHETHEGVL
ncbi:hypothetical protein [Mobilicoccus pelagius]|uniref:Uncharacterized protein n=1 Tax=Mobilicoccus pelagius NBRC 104925 TaxID=1089455 RepID=H5UMC8_9MICO|nr:hypothetical protein [Mobilicoccus pelagius]GAB46886.1 hypothetical protein MOPEL_001_00040 [Mobilicoccus pelagius NBRC 104925]